MDSKPPAFNEEVVEALKQSALRHKGFTHPVVYLKGTKIVIDGHHRIEAHKRLLHEGHKDVKLPIKNVETDDPKQLARELNKTRRSWNDIEERRTEAQFLSSKSFSLRVIAKTLGVSHSTIANDLARPVNNFTGRADPEIQLMQLSDGKTRRIYGDAAKEKIHDLREQGLSHREISTEMGNIPHTSVQAILNNPRPSTQKLNDFAKQRGTQWQREADERVREIQSGNHPETFKKAVKHFNNFDKLVQEAFEANDSNGWERYHWNFIKTEVSSIISIIFQQAEEANKIFNENYVGTPGWRAIEQRRSGTTGLLPISDNVDPN